MTIFVFGTRHCVGIKSTRSQAGIGVRRTGLPDTIAATRVTGSFGKVVLNGTGEISSRCRGHADCRIAVWRWRGGKRSGIRRGRRDIRYRECYIGNTITVGINCFHAVVISRVTNETRI